MRELLPATARAVLLLALAGTLAGCFWRRNDPVDCRMVQEYQESGSLTPLQTPDGLTRTPSSPVRIPDAAGAFDENTVGCLERPPNYFNRPIPGQRGAEAAPPEGAAPVNPPPPAGEGPAGPTP
ncbi:MAG: hypothetical protein JNM50_03715 [Chromatiales bacterium]|nr:hypothetical protein [Chromatiales bacterium]